MNARTARQWMVTHEWMVKPMAQTEWIEGKGLLVWLAEVFSALGTGLYLVSLFFGLKEEFALTAFWAGIFGWIMIAIFKLPLHLAYLGKPLALLEELPAVQQRLEDLLVRPGHRLHHDLPGVRRRPVGAAGPHRLRTCRPVGGIWAANYVFMVLAGVFCVMTAVYCGFAMSYCKSVPFWNTGLLPIVFLLMGVADGLALDHGRGPGHRRRSVIGDGRVGHPDHADHQLPAHRDLPGERQLPVGRRRSCR